MHIPPNIPWDQVLRHGPRVLDAATALFEKWQARRPEPVNHEEDSPVNALQVVEQRLQALESTEAEQAALVREMAREMQAMAAELQRQRVRSKVALALGVVALALGGLALVAARLG